MNEIHKTHSASYERGFSLGIHLKNEIAKNSKKMNYVIERGMVLGVSRGSYDHFGVYVGNNKIVHYTSEDSDVSTNNKIMKTMMHHFIRDANEFFVLKFPETYAVSKKAALGRGLMMGISLPFITAKIDSEISNDYTTYSREECACRAESRIGEDKYSLIINNCEHFAMWCKTGIEISIQLNRLFDCGIEISRVIPSNKFIPS